MNRITFIILLISCISFFSFSGYINNYLQNKPKKRWIKLLNYI